MQGLPPGPTQRVLPMVRYALDPLGYYGRCAQTYGDLFSVPTLLGPLVVCGHPDGVRTLFSADPTGFTRWSTDAVSPLLGESSVLLTSGERHRRDRKLLTPPFHGARMRAYGQLAQRATLQRASTWSAGRPFRMQDAASEIAIDIIVQAVFGVEAGALSEFREATLDSMQALNPFLMLFGALRRPFFGVGPYDRFLRARERIDQLTYAEIRRRKANGTHASGEDILSLMLQARYDDGSAMSEQEVRDQLLTLVFAGHETSAIGLAWAFYWLERTPSVRDRLLEELAALGPSPEPEALAAQPYLDAVCSETLRLFPVVPEVIRLLTRPLELQGYVLPEGVAVAACIALVHQRPDLYPEPMAFRPERFLERKFAPHEYLPFGGGARRCIGAAFAMYEMKIVLGTLLSNYRVQLTRTAPVRPVLRNLAMGPRGGVEVTVSPRSLGLRSTG